MQTKFTLDQVERRFYCSLGVGQDQLHGQVRFNQVGLVQVQPFVLTQLNKDSFHKHTTFVLYAKNMRTRKKIFNQNGYFGPQQRRPQRGGGQVPPDSSFNVRTGTILRIEIFWESVIYFLLSKYSIIPQYSVEYLIQQQTSEISPSLYIFLGRSLDLSYT